ncbi:palindromic element RPE2 domain-containing protein [Rickettsia endosymbiont of Halotydeus destructor]
MVFLNIFSILIFLVSFQSNIVKVVGFNYKERKQTPIIIGETISNLLSEFKSCDYSYKKTIYFVIF